ncbi:MAG: butyrate kinase [Sphaerochaetaceae bacterium]|nr:butyrate kinase [Sphaerochaetaceae bacterium]
MDYLLLVINPGSTSTKVALFLNDKLIQEATLRHDVLDLEKFPTIIDQLEFRKQVILDFLVDHRYRLSQIDVFVGRGGMLKPLKNGGTYLVTENMLADLRSCKYGAHASNLGALLASSFAKPLNRPAYIVDPVVIDEFEDIARVSGQALIKRKSVFHALNQKATAKRHARLMKKHYENLNLIVVHLGGGISVGLHKHGRVIDVNNALGGDGPFSPERTGTIPTYPLVELCFSGKYTETEIKKLLVGQGGLVSYLGTNDGRVVESRIEAGDEEARFYFDAMGYNIIKEIGAMYFVCKGKVDGVLLTGGMAYSKYLVEYLRSYLDTIVQVYVYPGEDEMRALADGTLRTLRKEEKLQAY